MEINIVIEAIVISKYSLLHNNVLVSNIFKSLVTQASFCNSYNAETLCY